MNIYAQNNLNVNQFTTEGKDLLKAPGNWNSSELIKFGSIVGTTILLMHFDEDIREAAIRNDQFIKSVPAEFGRYWGEPFFTGVSALLFTIHGIAFNNTQHKKMGFEIIESGIYASAVTGVLKYSFGRARPLTGFDAFTYNPFSFSGNKYVSFSSGHTALAFSLSTVLSLNTENDFARVLLYVPAVMTATSRVYQNHHWTSDVFFGACIGYFVGKFFYDQHEINEKFEKISPSKPLFSISLPIN
ncbi:MAG: phosphatase PAP2 family protein [Melioribacteraceae bacterium]|nr:phosphatase PAP2 family protein [Melioribacteraceae bacterium]